jgi:hypothetical protein
MISKFHVSGKDNPKIGHITLHCLLPCPTKPRSPPNFPLSSQPQRLHLFLAGLKTGALVSFK